MIAAIAAAVTLASSFVGNAVYVIPTSDEPALKLRLDTGGYDLVSAAAAARTHLSAAVPLHVQSGDRATYDVARPGALSPGALLQARPGALESTFVDVVDGTLSLGRFATQLLTIDFPQKTVTLGGEPPSGDRVTMTVGMGPRPAPNLVPSASALVPVTIGGERAMMLLDTGADVALEPGIRARFDDAAATRSLPLVSRALYDRLHARHPDWEVVRGAAHMAEAKEPVTLVRVPELQIGAHRAPPTWFAVREEAETYTTLTRMFSTRVEGDLGGEVFRAWRITIDVANEALIIR